MLPRFFLLLVPVLLVGDLSAQGSTFVPGEVLAKFTSGSRALAAVQEASKAAPPDLAMLSSVVEQVTSAIHVPVYVARIASGDWVVLSVDIDVLVGQAADQLRSGANVDDVRLGAATPEAPAVRPIMIRFAQGSVESQAVARAFGGEGDDVLGDVLASLQELVGLPVTGTVSQEDTLSVQVDLEKLTTLMVDRLVALPDVEAAQPNYIVGFRSRGH